MNVGGLMYDILAIQNKWVNKLVWLRRRVIVRAVQRTLLSLFPFALLGSIARVVSISFLSDKGFINSILAMPKWFPDFRLVKLLFNNFATFTIGILALLAAYYCAKYTTEFYRKDQQVAGITGLISYLFVCMVNVSENGDGIINLPVDAMMLGANGILLGLLVGYITGQIFRKFGGIDLKKAKSHSPNVLEKAFNSLLAIILSFLVAIVINGLLYLFFRYGVYDAIADYVTSISLKHSNFSMTLFGTFVTTIFAWLGFSGPYQYRSFVDDNTSVENLNYALKYHSVWGVPHPFSEYSLYHSFGAFGGIGSILALIVAILIVSGAGSYRRVGVSGLIPTLFNSGTSVMIGLPVMFNPLYLIPFILTPILNIVIAALAIIAHIMPPVVYPVPMGTPGPLVAFIGTGGNFVALIIGVIVFFIDIIVYIPFVRLNEQIWLKMQYIYLQEEKEGE